MSIDVRAALLVATEGLVEREALVELIVLAAVAREHLLIVGPPGTAKSEAVRRVARVVGGQTFEYLLGRFTEPSEIFGPVDLRKLKDGVVETETRGMLPEAEIAFLDEVFLGSSAILNTLLGVLNERVFRRGHTVVRCPLRVCVGASNSIPDTPELAAFADRFLLRSFVDALPDPRLEELLEGGWRGRREVEEATAPLLPLAELDALAEIAAAMDPSAVRPSLAQAVRSLRSAGVQLSDRRVVKLQRLITAAAALAGRDAPEPADLWPIVYAVPTAEAQALAREVLRAQLDVADNAALPAAAEDAAHGRAARARRLTEAAVAALAETPADAERAGWLLRLEGIARELDASFDASELSPELSTLRGRLVEHLEAS